MLILIKKRWDDWMSHLPGNTKLWEAGKTPEEALKKMLVTLHNPTDYKAIVLERRRDD